MAMSMPSNQGRAQMIRRLAAQQEADAGGRDRMRSAKLTVRGTTSLEPIYRFRLSDLAFNKANGRIKAEVIEKEAELGRTLDQFNDTDGKILKSLLLSIRPDENEKIKADLEKNTQINPGIITADGIVINGNRRKALLEEIHDKTHDEKYSYLDVHILPSAITKSELWLIEAGIQMSAPQQLDYSPINHLLKISEGLNSGLTIPEMAARIYGVTEEQIANDVKRLRLIDEYLTDFLGKEGKYYLVRSLNEHFINLQNILEWAERPRGNVRRDWIPRENDINELKLVGFYYIRMKFPHLRIRDLRDVFATSSAWAEAKKALSVDSNLTEDERRRFSINPSTEVEANDDEIADASAGYEAADAGTRTAAAAAEQRDLREEAIWRESHEKELKSIFQDAREQETITKDSAKPTSLARRALRNLEAISLEDGTNLDPNLDEILGEIISVVNRMRKQIKKERAVS